MKGFNLTFLLAAIVAMVSCNPEEQATPEIKLDMTSLTLAPEASSESIAITSNQAWTISSDASWIAFDPATGTGNGNVTISVSKNDTFDTRTADIKIASDKASATLTVSQKALSGIDRDREALMKIYAEMGGNGSWTSWGSSEPVSKWMGVAVNGGRVTGLYIGERGIPATCVKDCIAELTALEMLDIEDKNLTGTFPAGLSRASSLRHLRVYNTSLSGDMPDIFAGMQHLREISFLNNTGLTGSLPESAGHLPELETINFTNSSFTGNIPDSWFEHDMHIHVNHNHLTGKVPAALFRSQLVRENFYSIIYQRSPDDQIVTMDLSEIPYLPRKADEGTYVAVNRTSVNPDEVIAQNKYTIILYWGVRNPYGENIMDQVKALYEKYHDQGLEVIAINSWDTDVSWAELKEYLTKHGYDKWINIDMSSSLPSFYPMTNPAAEVISRDMHVLFTFEDLFTPAAKCSQTAVFSLAPFIKTLFGDLDPNHVSTDFSKDGEVTTLQKATTGKGINLVLMGDAYTDIDMAPGGHYETMMRSVMDVFFSVEPYKSFRNRFNVYMVKAVSRNCMIGEGMETALKTKNGEGRALTGNVDICFNYAMKVPSITSKNNLTIIAMVNNLSTGAANTGVYEYDSSVAFVSTYNDLRSMYSDIVIHEACGHGFAHLADEYQEVEGAPSSSEVERMKKQWAGKGWWANIDFTNDPSKIKWAHFLTDSRYKASTGIFKGGSTYTQGVWRPSEDSWMNEYAPYFNAPSREAIYKRMMLLSGETYSFEKFADYDKVNN